MSDADSDATLRSEGAPKQHAHHEPKPKAQQPHDPRDPPYLTGDDEAVEREMRDWGGDAPMDLPTVPGAGAARARRTSFVAAPPPNRAPDYRVPSGRERSGSTGTSAPPARRTTSGWSHQGQELHVVDTAFSEAHRELSRLSRQRAASASSAQRRGRDDGGKDDNEADDDDDEDQPDPNKVVWDGDDDAGNPQNWSTRKKWTVTVLCAQATLVVTFASSAPSSAVRQIAATYGVSNVAASLTTSLFLAGCAYSFLTVYAMHADEAALLQTAPGP